MRFDELHKLVGYEDYFEPMVMREEDKARRRELAELLLDAFLYFFSVFEVHSEHQSLLQKALYEQLLIDRVSDAVAKVTGIDGEMSDHIRELAREVVNTTYKHEDADIKAQVRQTPQNQTLPNVIDHVNNPKSESALQTPMGPSDPLKSVTLSDGSTFIQDTDMKDEVEGVDYWLSLDRAKNIANSEANTFLNYTDYVDAKSQGYKYKTWHTMSDPKVRETHAEIEGRTIGIDELFQVGDSLMKFPHDWESAPNPAEVINCRCSVEYR